MRFVHSLNTQPIFLPKLYGVPTYFRLIGALVYSAMSVAWVKYWGHDIVLHTDDIGKKLLELIPYDDIYLTVNDIDKSKTHPKYWAAAKMYAMDIEDVGSIHIDNDVFLKKKEIYDIIEEHEGDVIVQGLESAGEFYNKFSKIYSLDIPFCEKMGLYLSEHGALNTGTLSFVDKNLKDTFIQGYKKIVEHFTTNFYNELTEDESGIPDLMAEQKYLFQVTKGDYKVFLIDNGNEGWGHRIGYQHLLTQYKYTVVDKVLKMLSQVNPELWYNVCQLCDKIEGMTSYEGYDISVRNENND